MLFNIAFLTAAAAMQATNITPASEANIDAFVAAIPPSTSDKDALDATETEELERLLKLNPGRETKVRELIAAHRQCQKPLHDAATMKAVRSTARLLGDDRLRRMTEFYRKGEQLKLEALLAKKRAEEPLSAVEEAELKRLTENYPLQDFLDANRAVKEAMLDDEALKGDMTRCDDRLSEALFHAGLHQD